MKSDSRELLGGDPRMSRWMLAAALSRSLAAVVAWCGTRRSRCAVGGRRDEAAGRPEGPGRGRAHDLAVAALHRPRQERHGRRVRARDRRRRQVRRGDQRQPRVLREAPAAARAAATAGGRSLITVSDWLAARMYKLGYLQRFDYSQLPNVEAEPDPGAAQPGRRPRARVHRSLAERDDRADRAHRPGARRRRDRRPVRPEVQGQGDDADRDARHGADDAEEHGHRSRRRPPQDQWLEAVDKIDEAADSGQIRQVHRQRLHQGPAKGRHLDRARLVRRRGPAPGGQPEHRVRDAEGGLHALVDEHGDPGRRAEPAGRRRRSSTSSTTRRSRPTSRSTSTT